MQADPHVPGWTFRRFADRYFLGFAFLFLLSISLVVVFSSWLAWLFCVSTGILFGLVIYFFRDPVRSMERDTSLVYSPADGRVTDVTKVRLEEYPGSEYLRVGIFMSVLDVHVQRSPVFGEVDFVSHQPGKNYPAYDPAASLENDQIIMGIQTSSGLVLVKQIAGILARKCVNYVRPGERILSGQRYGLIKFGSRVELFLPPETMTLITVGENVIAGITPLAEMVNV